MGLECVEYLASKIRQLFIEVDRAADGLLEISQVQAFVLGMRVGVRILDADQERGRTAERFGERVDERDGAAATDRDRPAAITRA